MCIIIFFFIIIGFDIIGAGAGFGVKMWNGSRSRPSGLRLMSCAKAGAAAIIRAPASAIDLNLDTMPSSSKSIFQP